MDKEHLEAPNLSLNEEKKQSIYPEEEFFDDGTIQKKGGKFLAFICVAAIIVAVIVFLGNILALQVDIGIVQDSGKVSKSALVRFLGLQNAKYYTVDIKEIERKINFHEELRFISAEKVFPNKLYITVEERKYVALIHFAKRVYILCDDGLILAADREGTKKLQGILVEGLDLQVYKSGIAPVAKNQKQLNLCLRLLEEINKQGFTKSVHSIDVSEMINLKLRTKDKYHVRIGGEEYLGPKIATVRSIVNEMRKRKLGEGILEATIPGEGVYRPIK